MKRNRVNLEDMKLPSTSTPPSNTSPDEIRSTPGENYPHQGPLPPHYIPASQSGKVTFVPVGLSHAHLAWTEALVQRLRNSGDRQASRSKIIRLLIERYGQLLEEELLKQAGHTSIYTSTHGP